VNLLQRASSERWLLTGVALAGAVAVLAWNQWVRDDDDKRWTTHPEWLNPHQPPDQVGAPIPCRPPCGPGGGSSGRPMDSGDAMRTRAYPGSLAEASFSIIGEF